MPASTIAIAIILAVCNAQMHGTCNKCACSKCSAWLDQQTVKHFKDRGALGLILFVHNVGMFHWQT